MSTLERLIHTGMLGFIPVLLLTKVCFGNPRHSITDQVMAFMLVNSVMLTILYLILTHIDMMLRATTPPPPTKRTRMYWNIQAGYRIMRYAGLSQLPLCYANLEKEYLQRYGTLDLHDKRP
jgi:hypothetical protein